MVWDISPLFRRRSCAWENKTSEGIVWIRRSSHFVTMNRKVGEAFITTESSSLKVESSAVQRNLIRFRKDERPPGKRKRWETAGIAAAFTTVAVRTWDSVEHAWVLAEWRIEKGDDHCACENKRKHILAEKGDERPRRGTRGKAEKRVTAAFTTMAVWWCGVGSGSFVGLQTDDDTNNDENSSHFRQKKKNLLIIMIRTRKF